jgi:hypothetical protein
METNTPIATGEITNSCTCLIYQDEDGKDVSVDTEYNSSCYGDWWDFAVEDFSMITEELRNSNETNWWHVADLRLWNGQVSGYFHAKHDCIADILRGMTVRGDWTMRYAIFSDCIEFNLSHHDAPLGSASTLRCVSDDEREELGLY